MKKLGLIITIGLLTVILAACGGSSLVGRWESGSSTLEFFSDGSYKSKDPNYYGDYSAEGNRLMLEGVLMPAKSRTFAIKGDTLILYFDDGDVDREYTRTK